MVSPVSSSLNSFSFSQFIGGVDLMMGGQYDMGSGEIRCKYSRLYFSSRQFPTPVNLSQAVSCDSCECLRSYIIEQRKKEGEVLGTLAKNGKSVRFACKHKKCKFYFVLKWNELGYYILLYHKYNYNDKKDFL